MNRRPHPRTRVTAALDAIDQRLSTWHRALVMAAAGIGVLVVGLLDYATGYELSFSIFYLIPVSLAVWYGGRGPGIAVAVLACLTWLSADLTSGHRYSSPVIPLWNALVRFAFFYLYAILLTLYRDRLSLEAQLARVDSMTGALNWRAFSEQLEQAIARAQRDRSPLTVAYIDLDDFKQINDAEGHNEGDRVLCAVAQHLRDSVRRTDFVARVGGDEFVLLMPMTDGEGARKVVADLRTRLAGLAGRERPLRCSVGAVTFRDLPANADAAVKASDDLMYEVKRRGKDAVAFGIFDAATGSVQPA
jgi:diguanylate cyclase (GGDEF)-like protein